MKEDEEKHLESVLRHISHVRQKAKLLADKLIEQGQDELGRKLIARSLVHDNSKFYGIEWLYLRQEVKENNRELFNIALEQHRTNNDHHPEGVLGGINEMSDLQLVEFCCDISARSAEGGDSIRDWVKEVAVEKYKINKATLGRINKFLKLILEPLN